MWQEYIDLEYNIIYNDTIYWNALTDRKIKYMFTVFDGSEQLFDVSTKDGEVHDLVHIAKYAVVLKMWRGRMVEWLCNRGQDWVKNDVLQIRKQGLLYSPNYPA